MWKKILFIVICLSLTVGCGGLRKAGIKLSEEEVKNVETVKVMAANYLSIWPTQSGFIRGALGSDIDKLPTEATQAMAELDTLAQNEQHSDHELGYSLGLRVRILSEIVQQALEKYAPDVLDLLQVVR